MTNPSLQAERVLVLELHGLLSEIDPVRWRDDAAGSLRARLVALQQRLRQRERLASLAGALEHELPALDRPLAESTRGRWLSFKRALQPAYDAIAASLRSQQVVVPALRPTNWARSVFHVAGAAVAVLLIEVLSPWRLTAAAALYAGTFWCLELARRHSGAVNVALLRFFRHVVHPHEAARVNSSTWYATALVLLTLTHSRVLCLLGVVVLGVADPVAGFVGRRFGRVRLLHGRSLEGSLAFVVSGAAVALAALRLLHPELGLGAAAALSAAAAGCGALAELLSVRVDDNLSVPLAAAAGAALAMLAW